MIYAPSYQGKHNYSNYEKLKDLLKELLKGNSRHAWNSCDRDTSFILNIDFLFEKEIEPYFSDIFIPILFITSEMYYIYIESSDKKKFKEIRKIMKKHVIGYDPLIISKKKFLMSIYV